MKHKKVKRKRCQNRIANRKNVTFFGMNCAGIKSKLKSFEAVVKDLNPTVWMLQETKLKPNEKISCAAINDFQVYYLNRQRSQGGGIALGVNNNIESTIINEGDDETEMLSVKLFVHKMTIRIVTAYGPQENAKKDKKTAFWEALEKEVNCSEFENEGFILQMDGNLHEGQDLIKSDPNKKNQNGKLFLEFLERNKQLTVVNSLDICEGIITRSRDVEDKTEKAILDFFVVNEKLLPFVRKMLVDENKKYSLINLAQIKKNKNLIESDHNALVLELEIKEEQEKPKREEILNFRSKIGQELFRKETESNEDLLNCFKNNYPFDSQIKTWKKEFDDILKKCFKKIRITPKKKTSKTEELLKERVQLKAKVKKVDITQDMKEIIELRIKEIENDISEDVANENFKMVKETLDEISEGGNINGAGRKKMWSRLKKRFPKISQPTPVAKRDNKGNLITKHQELKKLYLKTYKQRMRNRPMKKELKDLKNMKENLFDIRLKLAEEKKSDYWKMEQLDQVLKALKKNKSRDPNGWINELFKEGVAGYNLKLSLLHICNKIKEENHIPDFLRMADISTIYKGKGSKKDLKMREAFLL